MDAESKYELMNDDEKDTIINASFEKFKKFAKDQYNVQELHEIVKEFFKYNANITADSRLKTPKEFCSDLRNQESGFWSNISMLCGKTPNLFIVIVLIKLVHITPIMDSTYPYYMYRCM
ncbi:uncharacterized protein LOC107882715 isoform X1 [Acyrthosiphon pisum]|uniref:Uncharacterized protein n=1 Tax=Acyrthosiphon pisum TaxID=7029 RepID=A0A8R2NP29_ACYPI|nr:uncharacterized protein LOC107882715 isoform X1 [Acyrthosiphon pisum]